MSLGDQSNKNYHFMAFAFVVCNALVWWILFSIGRSSLDTYGDMAEAYSWGISWKLGYDKHPPLSGWMAAAWFEVFPTRDWAYYLLAMVNQAIAFWFIFLAGKRWFTPEQSLLAVMLTSLIPLFGPDTGFKFNANSAMLPWVAVFAWSLIAGLQTGAKRYLILAGLAAGAACLVKYWAPVVLLAIILDVAVGQFRSRRVGWRPVVLKLTTVALVTELVFVPHMAWAVLHHWPGLRYAHEAHGFGAGLSAMASATELMTDLLLVALLPTVALFAGIYYLRAVPRWQATPGSVLAPAVPRPLSYSLHGGLIFVFAVALTAASAHMAGVSVVSKWLIPAWLFFVWSLFAVTPLARQAKDLIRPVGWMIGLYWVGLFAYVAYINPSLSMVRDATNQRHLVADEVTRAFRGYFGQPLRFVAGNEALSFSASFYSTDHPVAIPKLSFFRASWVNEAEVRQAGAVVLCDASEIACAAAALTQLGVPAFTHEWRGLDDGGAPASVLELFYPPSVNTST
jgi:4-amino-4-deoxy-L-arabinose transferase-like glycosyltransferase